MVVYGAHHLMNLAGIVQRAAWAHCVLQLPGVPMRTVQPCAYRVALDPRLCFHPRQCNSRDSAGLAVQCRYRRGCYRQERWSNSAKRPLRSRLVDIYKGGP